MHKSFLSTLVAMATGAAVNTPVGPDMRSFFPSPRLASQNYGRDHLGSSKKIKERRRERQNRKAAQAQRRALKARLKAQKR